LGCVIDEGRSPEIFVEKRTWAILKGRSPEIITNRIIQINI
jgi:hypothetical protein